MEGWIGLKAAGGIEPLLVGQAQFAGHVGIGRIETLGEGADERRQREEGAGDIEQGEPFGVVAGNGHGCKLSALSDQQSAGNDKGTITQNEV
jgi:hypothetical protein